MGENTRTWDNYVLETRNEFGSAARRNRGSYSGAKVHRIRAEYVVGVVDAAREPKTGTFGAEFLRTGKPVLFSARPLCGCTNGQHAARPSGRLAEKDVTCSKCGPAAAPAPQQ